MLDAPAHGNSSANESAGGRAPEGLELILPGVIYYLVILVGVVGNSTFIRLIATSRLLRRRTMNLYILNIATADLALNVIGLVDGTLYVVGRGWLLGSGLCKACRAVLVCCLYASILSLVAVAIERYCAVVYPLTAHALLSHSRVRHTIILIWAVAAMCSSPTAIFNQTICDKGRISCGMILSDDKEINKQRWLIFKYAEFTLFFALPLLTQLVLYSIIARKLRERQQRSLSEHNSEQPLDERAGARKMERRSRRGVICMLTTCVLVYFISYAPIQVQLFYQTATGIRPTWVLQAILTTLVYINSAANPIIYCSCNKLYRSKMKQMYANMCPGRRREERGRANSLRSSSRSGRRSTHTTHTHTNDVRTTHLLRSPTVTLTVSKWNTSV